MSDSSSFSAKIFKVGINPCVKVPKRTTQAFGRRGYVPVAGTLNGHPFQSTLVPVGNGQHRLYVNSAIRKKTGVDVGDRIYLVLHVDKKSRNVPMPKELLIAFQNNPEAKAVFEGLRQSYKKDIILYLNSLKRPETMKRNIEKIINYLIQAKSSNLKGSSGRGSILARPMSWYRQARQKQ